MNGAWSFAAADEDHAFPVECPAEAGLVGIVIARVAVPHAGDMARALNGEGNPVVGRGHHPPFGIHHIHLDQGQVFAISRDHRAVGFESQSGRSAGGLDEIRRGDAASVIAFGRERPGSVFHRPFEVAVSGHILGSQALAITKQLHALAVAEYNDFDFPSFFAGPIPVRHDMNDWVGLPP